MGTAWMESCCADVPQYLLLHLTHDLKRLMLPLQRKDGRRLLLGEALQEGEAVWPSTWACTADLHAEVLSETAAVVNSAFSILLWRAVALQYHLCLPEHVIHGQDGSLQMGFIP